MLEKKSQKLDWFPGTEPTKSDSSAQSKSMPVTKQVKIENDQFIPAAKPKSVSSDAIAKMQEAIIQLAQDVSSHDLGSKTPGAHKKETDSMGNPLGGYSPFGNILLNSYINEGHDLGSNFTTFISNMQKIGSGSSLNKPDGDWGTKTNIAVNNVFSLASGLIDFVEDMGIENNIYTRANVNEFGKLLTDDVSKLTSQQKEQLAPKITKHIYKIIDLYNFFESTILDHPEMNKFFSQEKPLFEEQKNQVNKQDLELTTKNPETVIPSVNVLGKEVKLKDIKDNASFKQFLSTIPNINQYDLNSTEFVKSTLKDLSNQLSRAQSLGF